MELSFSAAAISALGAARYEEKGHIYFLISKGVVVYVGKSINLTSRIKQHKKEGIKSFDDVLCIEVAVKRIDDYENFFIGLLSPKYNQTDGNSPVTYSTNWAEKWPDLYPYVKYLFPEKVSRFREFIKPTSLNIVYGGQNLKAV